MSENLGVDFRELPIELVVAPITGDALGGLRGPLRGEPPGAHPRDDPDGVLETSHGSLASSLDWRNKSEMAVGYATIIGDMVGRFALLKERVQARRFRLSRYLNERAGRELIPVTTIDRPPSAELRTDRRDDQSLPPLILDPILEAYVELDRSREELEQRFDPEVVARTLSLVDRADSKRRQAAPGVKLRPRAFGRDWRTPITNRWNG